MSFIDKLSEYVNLRVVVMIVGVILFGLGLLMGWHEIRTLVKVLLVFGAIAFYIGVHYNVVYNVTPPTPITQAKVKS